MKQGVLLSFLFCMSTLVQATPLSPNEAQELELKAQEFYTAGDHAAALQLFDSVNTVYSSADLFYNMGNCYFKLGDVPRSILYFERALRLDPGAEDVQANLDMARMQVVDRIDKLPGFALGATWGKLRGGSDVDQWARWALWGCLALFLSLSAGALLRQRALRNAFFGVAAAMVLFTLGSVALAAWRTAEIQATSEAIILAAKVDARSEPRSESPILFVLHKGTKVGLRQIQNEWYEVVLPNGNVGWMPANSLEPI